MKLLNIVVMLLVCQVVLAQKPTAEERINKRVERIHEIVNLTEEQDTQLYELYNTTQQEIKALNEETSDNHQKMKDLRKKEREALKTILSEDQLSKLQESRQKQKDEIRNHRRAIRTYHEKNVKPVVQEKRNAFNAELSSNELKIIEEARALMPERKHVEGRRKNFTADEKATLRAQRKEIHQMLQPIVVAHQTKLNAIKEELQPIFEAEKAFIEKNKPEDAKHPRKFEDRKRPNSFVYHFLLME
jgi:hypothetical protein